MLLTNFYSPTKQPAATPNMTTGRWCILDCHNYQIRPMEPHSTCVKTVSHQSCLWRNFGRQRPQCSGLVWDMFTPIWKIEVIKYCKVHKKRMLYLSFIYVWFWIVGSYGPFEVINWLSHKRKSVLYKRHNWRPLFRRSRIVVDFLIEQDFSCICHWLAAY